MEAKRNNEPIITHLKIESGNWRETANLLCPTLECKNFSQVLTYEPVIWQYNRFKKSGHILLAETHAHHCEDCGFSAYLPEVADEIDQKLAEKLTELGLRKITKQ